MRNRTLAIFGIISYLLIVIISIEDEEGSLLAPGWLIIIAGIVLTLFYVLALKRLWKYRFKFEFGFLLFSVIAYTIFSEIVEIASPVYRSPIIILNNVTKIVHLIAYFWAIMILWVLDKKERKLKQ